MNRDQSLRQLSSAQQPFDLVIVGGGATGLGCAVDAASRGHSVALIEQADFAKGTSSRSTKLVHGGVRYLRQGNVSLVLEALRERGRLARNAPHLVHDLEFIIPNYHWWEGPFYGIGMKVYDQLAGKLGLGPSRHLSKEETLARIPTIEPEGLDGGIIYHDGQFDDARLAICLARTASNHGAVLANYTRCEALLKDGQGHIIGVRARDLESDATFEIQGRCVINATGVFADGLRQQDEPGTEALVSPSQGIHFVLPREFLPGDAAIMIPKTDDGRVLFAVPWHGRVILGTTDTPLDEHSLEPRALPEEIDFLLRHAARYLTRDPQPEDVLSVYAGLRPLVGKAGGNTAALSRDHTILISPSGLLTITGGKWTTYRQMAQDCVDHAETLAGLDARPCITAELPLHGATVEAEQPPEVSPPEFRNPYGSDLRALREVEAADPRGNEPLCQDLPLTANELRWHVRQEMARTVEDVLARRSRHLLLDARAAIRASEAVARLLATELGRDDAWAKAQVAEFQQLARGYLLA